MKTIILIFSMLISLSSCNDDNTDKQENPLIGAWKHEATIIGTGGDDIVHTFENGEIIIFHSKVSFERINSDDELSCTSGTYLITEHLEEDFLSGVISLNCNNEQRLYRYSIENKKLFLTFLLEDGSFPCDEACIGRYTIVTEIKLKTV